MKPKLPLPPDGKETPRSRERKEIRLKRLAFFETTKQNGPCPTPPSMQAESSLSTIRNPVEKPPSEKLQQFFKESDAVNADTVRQAMARDSRVQTLPSITNNNEKKVNQTPSCEELSVLSRNRHNTISEVALLPDKNKARLSEDKLVLQNTGQGGNLPYFVVSQGLNGLSSQNDNLISGKVSKDNFDMDISLSTDSSSGSDINWCSTPCTPKLTDQTDKNKTTEVSYAKETTGVDSSASNRKITSPDSRKNDSLNGSLDSEILILADDGSDIPDDFKPVNLESVLGKEKYDRLMRNFKESDSILENDDDDNDTVVMSGKDGSKSLWNIEDSDEEELHLETHRPSLTNAPQTENNNHKSAQNNDSMTENNSVKSQVPSVKCAFSVDEIYTEAYGMTKPNGRGFLVQDADSDSDSDNGVAVPDAFKAELSVVSALSMSRDSSCSYVDQSLEDRQIFLPRNKPFGPLPQLPKSMSSPAMIGPTETESESKPGVNSTSELKQSSIDDVRSQSKNPGVNNTSIGCENPTLERYFSSIQNSDSGKTPASDTFEPVPEPDIDLTPRSDLNIKGKRLPTINIANQLDAGDKQVVHLRDTSSQVLAQVGHGESDDDRTIGGDDEDDDLLTKVTSLVSEVNPRIGQNVYEVIKDSGGESSGSHQPSSTIAKICPDCAKINQNVTWCDDCGTVLARVDPVVVGPRMGVFARENVMGNKLKPSENKTLPKRASPPEIKKGNISPTLRKSWASSVLSSKPDSEQVIESDRLLYNESPNPRDSLPNHIKRELSLNLRCSVDSSAASSQCENSGVEDKPKKRKSKVVHGDMAEDIQFEYRKDKPCQSLPNALQAELSLDLRASHESSDRGVSRNQGELSSRVHVEKMKAPLPPEIVERELDELAPEDDEEEEADVDFVAASMMLEDGEASAVTAEYQDFVNRLISDPRFKPTEKQRPKSAGPQASSSSPQPTKSKGRPQSAGKAKKYDNVQSKVRASMDAEKFPRRWQRSSVAWTSYNSGELSKPSSVCPSKSLSQPLMSKMKVNQRGGGDGDANKSQPVRARPASAGAVRKSSRAENVQDPMIVEDNNSGGRGDGKILTVHSATTAKGSPGQGALNTYAKYQAMGPGITQGDVSVWQCLPDEILLLIFSYLSQQELARSSRVCQQFQRVATDKSLWKKILLKKKNVTDDWLTMIGKHQPTSLSFLHCYGDKVTAAGMRELFRQCSDSLQELICTSCCKGALTGDSLLLHAASRCRNISTLDVSWCSVNENGIAAMAEASNQLESLCVNGCQSVSDDTIHSVVRKHGIYLRVLELFGCFNVTSRGAASIASYCKSLVTLNLGQCWKLTDASLAQLSASLSMVENLDLRGCKQLKDTSVQQVVKNCPRLRTLAVANCPLLTDLSLGEIATYCPQIRSLDVCGCKNMTTSGVKFLSTCCDSLQYLDFSSTGINHKSISSIASYCNKNLEVLKINYCKHITPASLCRLVKNCKKLKKLFIYGVKGIINLEEIRRHNPSLWIEKD